MIFEINVLLTIFQINKLKNDKNSYTLSLIYFIPTMMGFVFTFYNLISYFNNFKNWSPIPMMQSVHLVIMNTRICFIYYAMLYRKLWLENGKCAEYFRDKYFRPLFYALTFIWISDFICILMLLFDGNQSTFFKYQCYALLAEYISLLDSFVSYLYLKGILRKSQQILKLLKESEQNVPFMTNQIEKALKETSVLLKMARSFTRRFGVPILLKLAILSALVIYILTSNLIGSVLYRKYLYLGRIILSTSYIPLVIWPCVSISNAIKKIQEYCSNLELSVKNAKFEGGRKKILRQKLILTVKLITFTHPHFTAAGFFEINNEVYIYVFSAIVSYSILYIQMKPPKRNYESSDSNLSVN